ncbi:MAG: hypothetical protein JWL95_2045 [Gemmatimonadetes bacterium]|nr:hypothetical protein [Gemmatimonadota bacterium]
MSENSEHSFRSKTRLILAESGHEAALARFGLGVEEAFLACVREAFAELPAQSAYDLAFHLSDWRADAAFLLALHLAPGRFSAEEVKEGVTQFLVHAPNHVAAAAKLGGWPVEDVFGIGALEGE